MVRPAYLNQVKNKAEFLKKGPLQYHLYNLNLKELYPTSLGKRMDIGTFKLCLQVALPDLDITWIQHVKAVMVNS